MGFDFIKALNGLDTDGEETRAATKVAEASATAAKAPVNNAPVTKTAAQAKVAAFVEYVENRTEKVAGLMTEEKGEKHAQLFRNCVSACFHTKMAGYAPYESDDPSTFMAMAYNMYKDILGEESN